MDRWWKYINEVKTQSPPRGSVAGINKAVKVLTGQGGNTGGNPTGMEPAGKPIKKKRKKNQTSAPPSAEGGGAIGNPGPPALGETRQDTRPATEPSQLTSPAQQRYKKLRRKNDIYSQPAGHKNLSTGTPFTTKSKRAGTDRLRFEEVEPESFEKQPELDPKIWQDDILNKNISKRLMRIAREFLEGIDKPIHHEAGDGSMVALMEDLRLTGSLANYNWSKYSDIDLHIVVDFSKIDENIELVEQFFYGVIWRWNELHDIMIYGHEVEIFVENVGHVTHSGGIYSIMNNEWISTPDPENIEIDYVTARKKADAIETEVNMVEKFVLSKPHAAIKSIERLKKKIRRMRKAGLHSPQQEYSAENIAFKILRREETLDRLNDMKYDVYDKILSIGE